VVNLFSQARKTEFVNPPASYRPMPFWSWNAALDDAELRRQVQEFKAAGYGGYFMHSRAGLETRYLSDDWFHKVRVTLEEGKRQGLESWLYDEDKWPSGFAGGLATHQRPDLTAAGLGYQVISRDQTEAASKDPATLGIYEDAEQKYLWFFTRPYKKANWYNGEAYLDVLNPRAVARFLQLTFDEGYTKRFAKEFGPAMPGVFTDEPNYQPGRGRDSTQFPWTPEFPRIFTSKRGYDLIEKLPWLVRPLPGYRQVRYDFWRTAAEQFEEAFSKPYGELMAKLGLQLTGHYLAEDTLRAQTAVTGSVMLHYLHQQIPGIDHLRRNVEDPLTLKQASSVAHQFGRPRVLTEIYGVSGHSASFEDLKWIADFHFALGVNFLVPHLTLYSMTGDRKRDYPPTFSDHQPYWSDLKYLNDYLARAAWFVTQGRPVKDTLLLSALGSAWAEYPDPKIDEKYTGLLRNLLELHLDFDIGDELILARHGRPGRGRLQVGPGGSYSMVVVPPAYRWEESTLDLLEEMITSGGRVLFIGQQPLSIQRLLLRTGVARVGEEKQDLARAFSLLGSRDLSITTEGRENPDVFFQQRAEGTRHFYFVANTNRERGYRVNIHSNIQGGVEEWDLATGEVRPLTSLARVIPRAGSFAFVVDTSLPPSLTSTRSTPAGVPPAVSSPESFAFRRMQPNSLVLDSCRYSINGAPLSDPAPVWKVRAAAVRAAGLEAYAGLQPWALEWKGIRPSGPARVRMQFTFTSELVSPKAWLVVEKGANFAITVNGAPSAPPDGWHWDRAFTRYPLPARGGQNVIELTGDYRPGVEIEDLFVIGDFATRQLSGREYALAAEPATLAAGDWTAQGYHFYAGNMVYQVPLTFRRGEQLRLRLKDPAATAVRVEVNGKPAGVIAWQPWEINLTPALRNGQNLAELIVLGSLQNSFGPLHNDTYRAQGNNWWFGPQSFTDEKRWTDSYHHTPYGLLGGVEVLRVPRKTD
jgi:hypothetical protein